MCIWWGTDLAAFSSSLQQISSAHDLLSGKMEKAAKLGLLGDLDDDGEVEEGKPSPLQLQVRKWVQEMLNELGIDTSALNEEVDGVKSSSRKAKNVDSTSLMQRLEVAERNALQARSMSTEHELQLETVSKLIGDFSIIDKRLRRAEATVQALKSECTGNTRVLTESQEMIQDFVKKSEIRQTTISNSVKELGEKLNSNRRDLMQTFESRFIDVEEICSKLQLADSAVNDEVTLMKAHLDSLSETQKMQNNESMEAISIVQSDLSNCRRELENEAHSILQNCNVKFQNVQKDVDKLLPKIEDNTSMLSGHLERIELLEVKALPTVYSRLDGLNKSLEMNTKAISVQANASAKAAEALKKSMAENFDSLQSRLQSLDQSLKDLLNQEAESRKSVVNNLDQKIEKINTNVKEEFLALNTAFDQEIAARSAADSEIMLLLLPMKHTLIPNLSERIDEKADIEAVRLSLSKKEDKKGRIPALKQSSVQSGKFCVSCGQEEKVVD